MMKNGFQFDFVKPVVADPRFQIWRQFLQSHLTIFKSLKTSWAPVITQSISLETENKATGWID